MSTPESRAKAQHAPGTARTLDAMKMRKRSGHKLVTGTMPYQFSQKKQA